MLRERHNAMGPRRRLPKVLPAAFAAATALCLAPAAVATEVAATPPADAAPPVAFTLPAGPFSNNSGTPPPELRLRAIVTRALEDSVATWTRLMRGRAVEVAAVSVQFVSRLGPGNCFGLYAGDGPAYCSGNRTVLVGTDAANRLMNRFGRQAEAGITFLIGHEVGHHIQNLNGSFHRLGLVIAASPEDGADHVRRFELQADCYAGVWVHDSTEWASSDQFRADLLAVLSDIGDDAVLVGQSPERIRRVGLHGTTQQRTRWFLRGVQSGELEACDTFSVDEP